MACKAARQYLRDFEKENPKQRVCAVKHQIGPKYAVLPRRKVLTLDNSLPASELLQSLQKLTNIVYLTKLDAGDKVKVRRYMTEAEGELASLKEAVMKLARPNSPQPVN
jgi:hypothetical protein